MKKRILKHIGNASVAAVALTFGPAAFAQSVSNSQTYNQTQDQRSGAQGDRSSSDPSTSQRSPQWSQSSTSTQTDPSNSDHAKNQMSSDVSTDTSSNNSTDPHSSSSMANSGAAQYGSQSPDPQYGAPSAGAARFGSKDASSTSALSSSSQIRIAAKDDKMRTADKLNGKKLRGSDGKDLGSIKDFLVDPQSGKVCFAVVSSGGVLGIGDTLHLVPYDVLKQSGDRDFTVAMTQTEWKQSPSLKEDKFEEGRISLDSQMQQQISQTFSSSEVKPSSDQLVRATKISGRDLVANNQEVGKIDGIVLENGQMTASALVTPKDDFVHTEQKFLVPLDRLQITAGGKDKVTASLTREDFSNASQTTAMNSATAATDSTTKVRSNEQSQDVSQGTAALAPTGSPTSGVSGSYQASSPSSTTQNSAAVASTDSTASAPASSMSTTTSPTTNDMSSKNSSAEQSTGSSSSLASSSNDQSSSGSSASNSSVATTPRSAASSDIASNSSSGSSATGTSSLSAGMNSITPQATTEPAPGNDSGFAAPAPQNSTSSSVATADRTNSANTGSFANSSSDSTQASERAQGSSSNRGGFASNSNASASNQSQPSSQDSSNVGASVNTQTPSLSPTGSTSDDQNMHASGNLVSSARAIRQALDQDPSTSQADVTVTPGDGKIMLKGMVKDASTKSKIEKTARQAAQGVDVESNLNVQSENK